MKRTRYLLCLLGTIAMFVFALPRLAPGAEGLGGLFSLLWISFCLIVFAGNLAAFLFTAKDGEKKQAKRTVVTKKRAYARG
ncbi:hypothetical protein [Bacillus fonticola]|uniref:hypothetical protein n=1 Tax=Bacillus fonticola TaxID=2728853 RepID=UPI001475A02A|nr:hypothetical protein [Bacillus fonticola]